MALAAWAEAPPDPAQEALRRDPSLKVRAQAALVLGQRGSPEAVPALRRTVAEDAAPAVRIAALTALARLKARVARPTLRAARQADPDPAVRAAAARALEALGPVAVVIGEIAGPPSTRAAVGEALGRRLTELGFSSGEPADLHLRPAVRVDLSTRDGKTTVAVRASLSAVDGDGHVELLEATATATLGGPVTDAATAAATARAVEAACRALGDDLAARLQRQ
jgi:HEAT repeats